MRVLPYADKQPRYNLSQIYVCYISQVPYDLLAKRKVSWSSVLCVEWSSVLCVEWSSVLHVEWSTVCSVECSTMHTWDSSSVCCLV